MVLAAKRESVYLESQPVAPVVPRPVQAAKRRVRLHPMLFVFIVVVPLATWTAYGVSQQVRVMELEYKLQALETELHQVQREGQLLEFKIEQLQSLARIEGLARARLGMVTPSGTQTLALGDWDISPDIQYATNPGPRQILARGAERLWSALSEWVGARLPMGIKAEAGLLPR